MKERILNNLNKLVPIDKEVVYVNIGTPRALFDSFAPLLGTLLKEKELDVEVYGDIDEPIHALNICEYLENVIPKDKFVIAIDSCLGKIGDEVGDIKVRNCPIRPGAGCGKTLPEVGDISIIGITLNHKENMHYNSVKFLDIYKMANELVDIIKEFEESRKVKVNE